MSEEIGDEEIDTDEGIKKFKEILIKLSTKDFVIILLCLMLLLMYVLHQKDIEACNRYLQEQLRNCTRLTTSLWQI